MLLRLVAVHEKNKRNTDVHKTFLAIVVVCLVRNDLVGAENAYQKHLSYAIDSGRSLQRPLILRSFPSYAMSDEGRRASDLLDAWRSHDANALAACIKQQTFEFLAPAVRFLLPCLAFFEPLFSTLAGNSLQGGSPRARAQAVGGVAYLGSELHPPVLLDNI